MTMEIEGQEATDKSKFAKRSSFKKSKHKAIEPVPVVKETEKNEAHVSPKKELVSIYSYRNEENVLIKHKPGKRSVTFSSEPVRIEYAAPRTFTRNYIKSNHKKKKDTIHSEGLIMLMNNPEILQRLDNANESAKPADQSTPDSDLSLKVNMHDQIKISYFKPPSAGSYVPPSSIKDGSDGESNSSGESGEENVYVVGQSEHDEECLNILSNGLDDDDEEDDSFFSKSIPLKETNIDDVIFSAKMTEVIEKSSPKKFKETSLIDPPPPPVPAFDPIPDPAPVTTPTTEESEESEESSMGSVDSGIHEAGTDHDSPVEERLPAAPAKPTVPPKPSTSAIELPKSSVEKPVPIKPVITPKPQVPSQPQVAPKPQVVAKPQVADRPQVVAKPQVASKPQPVAKPQVASKPQVIAKPQLEVPAQPRWQRQVPVLSKPLQQVSPMQVEQEEETDSESEESETSSISSDGRPPSPDGHEMTYLQYDEEPMLPKYKKEIQIEKIEEALKISQDPNGHSPDRGNRPPASNDVHLRNTEFIPNLRPKAPTPEIPRTSLENFFGPSSATGAIDGSRWDSRRDSKRDSQLLERHEMEQQQLRELQKLKQREEQQLKNIQMQQEIEKQKLAEIQAQQHIQRQMETKRQQELQLQIEREQLQELQRHRELQQIQEMQRLELLKIQEEERRREFEAQQEYQRQLEEQKQNELEAQLERERLRIEQEKQAQLEKQRLADLEKQRQLDLIKQIEAEKQRQFEGERQARIEAEKSRGAQQAQQNVQMNSDFEDIDSLLEGLMELDPIISQQKQSQPPRTQHDLEAERRRNRQREEEERRRREEEEARALQKEKERVERLKLENQRKSAEEAEKKKMSDLEALRERKRKMREMSLDEVLKLQKEKKKGSPTPSVRSESVSYASLKRNSNESLNSVTASLDRSGTGTRNQGNQMIAPISLLHEIINPYSEPVLEEPSEPTRSLPVIVDNLLVTTPQLPPRTDLENKSPGDTATHSPSNTMETDSSPPLHLSDIKTKLDSDRAVPASKAAATDNTSHNSLLDPYIITAKIETYSGTQPQQLTPPSKPNPAPAWSPNTVKAKQQEQWLDIDDLLADVQSMIDNRSTQPAVPPRIVAPSSPRSINTSASSYNDVFDATPPPLPPKVPSRSNSPNSAQQPPLPARSFATSNSTPPLSPRGASPINPAVAPFNTPPRSPPVPIRTNLSDSGRSNPSSEPDVIPRSSSEGTQYKRSAFQNFQPTPNPHEDAIRTRSSIEELNRRTEQLSLQRNQAYTSSFRSSQGAVYPLSPQPQESTLTTNVTVPFYQPQKMYQRQYSPAPEYAALPPPPQGYGYTSPPHQYSTPPVNQPPLVQRNAAPPPPLPRRQNSDKVAKHHTVV